ncbi:MAG TPA: N-acetylmuramic acid 6-phosphate etherase [Candidatus Baltobacteraceae bacterium]|nr:N-acetylmuramic acid 6-phosphate etherase [Candidatus Baltobacteraceae bacterium]
MSNALPATEERNPESGDLDLRATPDLVALIAHDHAHAVTAVERAAPAIARVVDAVVERLLRGGRLHYVGAGTSGRLGVLDASEIPPTFGAAADLVRGHIAGGDAALTRAIEGAEDDAAAGAAMIEADVAARDAVIGLSASGGAPYVLQAIERARSLGAYAAAIVNAEGSPIAAAAQDAIVLTTGAEVLAGSTRLKAGTAQKIVLNTISTAVMVRLGKVHDNLMVDVVATNAKLRARALRLVQLLTGLEVEKAQAALDAASGRVKVAVVMTRRDVDAATAIGLLERERGSLRALL